MIRVIFTCFPFLAPTAVPDFDSSSAARRERRSTAPEHILRLSRARCVPLMDSFRAGRPFDGRLAARDCSCKRKDFALSFRTRANTCGMQTPASDANAVKRKMFEHILQGTQKLDLARLVLKHLCEWRYAPFMESELGAYFVGCVINQVAFGSIFNHIVRIMCGCWGAIDFGGCVYIRNGLSY